MSQESVHRLRPINSNFFNKKKDAKSTSPPFPPQYSTYKPWQPLIQHKINPKLRVAMPSQTTTTTPSIQFKVLTYSSSAFRPFTMDGAAPPLARKGSREQVTPACRRQAALAPPTKSTIPHTHHTGRYHHTEKCRCALTTRRSDSKVFSDGPLIMPSSTAVALPQPEQLDIPKATRRVDANASGSIYDVLSYNGDAADWRRPVSLIASVPKQPDDPRDRPSPVQASPDSHFYVSETERFDRSARFVDRDAIHAKQKLANKIKYCVRDKNIGTLQSLA
ncbi:hypothetical protein SeMB42_g00976 [Synchytrium endobioticum]|uniref:Uncharacterized protein n=1 Tax=Synchytrium endobioticum TaxID=286115 RepID=A0A507D0T0_9FUNG|nr:hypothetical protein SeLEV6574_g04122 [Synchytrium endobioticum]TPX53122.1 hypothetical protein SeMB42_g00976 [Synchytrium endobioticum]